MNIFVKSNIVLILAAIGGTPVLAQQIHAGSATGSYTNDFCPEVQKTLGSEYFEHQCATSEGTGDNVEKVLANPKDVGLGQFDIVAARATENPDKLAIVNANLGLECLYAVTKDASVTRLKGLSPRMPVALPSEKSGSTATFKFLQTLDSSLAELRNVTYHGSAMEAVQAVINGDAALAFFVQFPNTKNAVFQAINDAKLNFVPVINRQILRHEVAGYRVYEPQEVVVTPSGLLGSLVGKEPTKVDTTCTPVMLFTGQPGLFPEGSNERKDQEDVVKLLANTPRPSGGDWTDVFKNAVAIGQDKVEALIEKYSN
jgi:hypothetical protein